MLNIHIICVGKIKETYLKAAILEYSKRLSRFCVLNITEIQDEKLPEKINTSIISEIKNKECSKILKALKKDSFVIALDLKGKEFSSEDFTKQLNNIALNFNSSITFIIGGTLGLTDEILNISNLIISFSKMTFPHQLIRVFLLEQIFRAFKISSGETYHW